MTLDTNIFYPGAKIAVNCVSNEEAVELINAVYECFPREVLRSGFKTDSRWDLYEHGTCYAFWTYTPEGAPSFVYCKSDFFKRLGYDVVSIYDAMLTGCVVEDINLDDTACISCLFGG